MEILRYTRLIRSLGTRRNTHIAINKLPNELLSQGLGAEILRAPLEDGEGDLEDMTGIRSKIEECMKRKAYMRRILKSFGVRFGAFSLYLPALLTAEALALGEVFAHLKAPRWRPAPGKLNVLPSPAPPIEALSLRGRAQTERGQYGFGELPDRIVVYRKQHLAECDTVDELRDEVHTTLVHEIGHYYGIDDERLHELGWA